MFRESLRPSSGGQTAFSLPIVFRPVVTVVMLESRLASCVHCVELVATNRCTLQTFTESEVTRWYVNTIFPPEDGHVKDRNMSRIIV